jgi:diaminopimelate decarboxylase
MTTKMDLFPVSAEAQNGYVFRVAGIDLVQLARQYGTPLYLYDALTITQNYRYLQSLLVKYYPGKSEIAYAAKAYLSLKFARKLANFGASIDVVSAGELAVALDAGFSPEKIHLHGNNKSEGEICQAVDRHIASIVVDSLDELHYLCDLCRCAHMKPDIWLRLNPDISVDTHRAVQTGHSASKFGIPIVDGQAVLAIREARANPHVNLKGVHTHLGSQLFDAGLYGLAVERLMGVCRKAGWMPEVISPGGGWGVPYTEDTQDNDPQEWIQVVGATLKDDCERKSQKLPALVIEPGRWLAARAGVALYTVGSTRKSPDGEWIAALDGGMADNPRPALYGSTYTAELIGDTVERPLVPTRLVGRFCESGDELIHCIDLPKLERGDLVAIPVSGAYQLSMASNYNLAGRPCVLWLENGQVEMLQPREDICRSVWWSGG